MQDWTKAMAWYHKAAAQGSPDAMCNAGKCHHEGLGVPQDVGEAVGVADGEGEGEGVGE